MLSYCKNGEMYICKSVYLCNKNVNNKKDDKLNIIWTQPFPADIKIKIKIKVKVMQSSACYLDENEYK